MGGKPAKQRVKQPSRITEQDKAILVCGIDLKFVS
jgi:hypothetical protein